MMANVRVPALIAAFAVVIQGFAASAQQPDADIGGGEVRIGQDLDGPTPDIRLPRAEVASMSPIGPDGAAANTRFTDGLIFPMRQSGAANAHSGVFHGPYFDNNAAFPNQVQDYNCAARTYDLASGYNHAGTDLVIGPYWWPQMDAEEVEVVAALGGEIVLLQDGQFDRVCTWDEANPPEANYVYIRHDDGQFSLYLHMKSGSLSHLQVGQRVEQGDHLGYVGSSGFSQLPHLHFETRDAEQVAFDPFGGLCSAGESRWRHQWGYRQTQILRVDTLSTPFTLPSDSCAPMDPQVSDVFQPGQPVTVTVYLADQPNGEIPVIEIFRPDGSRLGEWPTGGPPPGETYSIAYWYVTANLPSDTPAGVWRVRVTYAGEVRNRHFTVGEAPQSTRIASALLPSSRSVRTASTATAFFTIANTTNDAFGCWISPDTPLNAEFHFQATDPATNALVGTPDTPVNIPAGGSQSFALFLTPRAGSEARSHEVRFNARCANSVDAVQVPGVNSLLLSFGQDVTPDIVALAATIGGNGVLALPSADGAAAFSLATVNLGSAGTLTVRPRLTNSALSATLTVCRTNAGTGACETARAAETSHAFGAGETATFAVFARGDGTTIPFSPRSNRVAVDIVDGNGVVRGSTSVAIRTD